MNREDILNSLGLQTVPDRGDNILPAMGIFATGILVGAGLGLLFAPKPGRELRDDLRRNAEGLGENIKTKAEDLKTKAEDFRARLPDPREVLHNVQNAVTGGSDEEPQKQIAGGGKKSAEPRPQHS